MNATPLDEELLTAFALNEVDPAERARIEELLKNDAAAQKIVDDVRATATALTFELKNERFEGLAPLPTAAAPKTEAPAPQPKVTPMPKRTIWTIASIAALVVLAFFAGTYFRQSEMKAPMVTVAYDAVTKSPAPSRTAPVIGNEGQGWMTPPAKTVPTPDYRYADNAKPERGSNHDETIAVTDDFGKTSTSAGTITAGNFSVINGGVAVYADDGHANKKKDSVYSDLENSAKKAREEKAPTPADVRDHFNNFDLDKKESAPEKKKEDPAKVSPPVRTMVPSNPAVPPPATVPLNESPKEAAKPPFTSASAAKVTEAPIVTYSGTSSGVTGARVITDPNAVVAITEDKTKGVRDNPVSKTTATEIPPGVYSSKDLNELKVRGTKYDEKKEMDKTGINGYIATAPTTPPQPAQGVKKEADSFMKNPAPKAPEITTQYNYWGNNQPVQPGGETYVRRAENAFDSVRTDPLSTFSVDVDTAAYSNVRRFLGQNQLPPPDAVRIEELINYFKYNYESARGEDPFTTSVESAACPWNAGTRLVRVAVKAHDLGEKRRPNSNLVFLIDVSGSMDEPNRLPLVKEGMIALVKRLTENDRVAIVTYAGQSGVALPSTNASNQAQIISVINSLRAVGSTNGGAGIQTAYTTAKENFIRGGVNRVILATDGDFNVGVTSPDELVRMIEMESKSGVFLTALGYGMGNFKDATLQRLADKGHGNYAYIDNAEESRKVLLEQMNSTLVSVAKDVKFQVEFNPARALAYRLIGYEKRIMPAQDFNNDAKDAGVIGAGHTVTAFYEVVPVGGAVPPNPDLKYQARPVEPLPPAATQSAELLTVKIRYKQPEGDVSKRLEVPFTDKGETIDRASADFRFAAGVALFGQVLKQSQFIGNATMRQVLELTDDARGADEGGYRREFIQLVRKAGELRGERY